MNRRIWLCLGVVVLLLFLACGPKVIIPPKVDLRKYQRVGLIGFACNAEGNLHEFLTWRFLRELSLSREEVCFVELGGEQEVLESVEANEMNSEAIRAIGQKHGVNAVFTGNVQIAEVKPLATHYPFCRPIVGSTLPQGMRVKALVKVWLTARLWEAEQGGTVWRSSVLGDEMVHQVTTLWGGKVLLDPMNPREAFWDLGRPLVRDICDDFKTKRVRME